MAFTDFDILEYFKAVFVEIGIPENNIHLETNFRDKNNQNLPSLVIRRFNETVNFDSTGRRVKLDNQRAAIIQSFKRIPEFEIEIITHLQDSTESEWHMGKILALFFRESGLNAQQFTIGTTDENDAPDNQARLAKFINFRIDYKNINSETRPVVACSVIASIEYFEYSTKV